MIEPEVVLLMRMDVALVTGGEEKDGLFQGRNKRESGAPEKNALYTIYSEELSAVDVAVLQPRVFGFNIGLR